MLSVVEKIKNISPARVSAGIKKLAKSTVTNVVFISVLYLYVVKQGLIGLTRVKILGKVFKAAKFEVMAEWVGKIMRWFDFDKKKQVSRSYLIELAFRNMRARKVRSTVTIGGVALGVGAIVFLVSIGYGLEKMVISKVARLEELKMADISAGKVSSARLNDEMVKKIESFKGVKEVIPVVSMVAKVAYNNSVLDVMSFGVDERYLKAIGPKYLSGVEFATKGKEISDRSVEGAVKGTSEELVWTLKGEKAEEGIVKFNVEEGEKAMVWEDCQTKGSALGVVIRSEGGYVGEKRWGERVVYDISGKVGRNVYTDEEYSVWMRGKVPLWKVGENREALPMLSENGKQKWVVGCLMMEGLIEEAGSGEEFLTTGLDEYLEGERNEGEVLGVNTTAVTASASGSIELTTSESTASAAVMAEDGKVASASAMLFETVVATDSSGIEWVELKKVAEDKNKVETVAYVSEPVGEAYVSSGMLKMLGLPADKVVGKKFESYYIITDSLISGKTGRMQSEKAEYTIKGVIDDQSSSYYYFQIADAKRLGIDNYLQAKIVTQDEKALPEVRKSVETLGFRTTSTVDTVAGIEKIFATLRVLLGFLGTVALAVASLGMFNTMTVSLLERTREVGVMKAMGMLSEEVRELFLAESMIMGVGGGTFGVIIGYMMGRLLSFGLSTVSMMRGQGMMDVAYIPWFFVAFIMLVSFTVGIITGWYPSKRARQISALNALRYE